MIYNMPFKVVINHHWLSFAERKEVKQVIKDGEEMGMSKVFAADSWTEIMIERSLV